MRPPTSTLEMDGSRRQRPTSPCKGRESLVFFPRGRTAARSRSSGWWRGGRAGGGSGTGRSSRTGSSPGHLGWSPPGTWGSHDFCYWRTVALPGGARPWSPPPCTSGTPAGSLSPPEPLRPALGVRRGSALGALAAGAVFLIPSRLSGGVLSALMALARHRGR